jgi:hypothetical protein
MPAVVVVPMPEARVRDLPGPPAAPRSLGSDGLRRPGVDGGSGSPVLARHPAPSGWCPCRCAIPEVGAAGVRVAPLEAGRRIAALVRGAADRRMGGARPVRRAEAGGRAGRPIPAFLGATCAGPA